MHASYLSSIRVVNTLRFIIRILQFDMFTGKSICNIITDLLLNVSHNTRMIRYARSCMVFYLECEPNSTILCIFEYPFPWVFFGLYQYEDDKVHTQKKRIAICICSLLYQTTNMPLKPLIKGWDPGVSKRPLSIEIL